MDSPVWDVNGVAYYRASYLGSCMRALAAARMGYTPTPPPEKLAKTFEAGHRAEDDCVEHLRSLGWNIYSQQRPCRMLMETSRGGVAIVGHIDGIGESPGAEEPVILEIKSQGASTWAASRDNELWDRYRWQASVYMHALRMPLTWVRWHRDNTAGQSPRIEFETLREPPYTMEQIRERLDAVEEAASRAQLPTECSRQFGCAFYYLHEEPGDEVPPARIFGLSDLAAAYWRAQQEEAAARRAKEVARQKLVDFLAERHVQHAIDGRFAVRLVTKERSQINQDRLAEDGIDLSRYRETVTYQQIFVHAKGVKG